MIIWSCLLLHNWRVSTVDRVQTKTYFDYLEAKYTSDNSLSIIDSDVSSLTSLSINTSSSSDHNYMGLD